LRNTEELERQVMVLGFANFYHRFNNSFSGVTRPITNLTYKKGQNFHCRVIQVTLFQQLKDTFTSTPILKYFDPKLEVIIETDASNFAIGYNLSQKYKG
jgi:hypothetical protein